MQMTSFVLLGVPEQFRLDPAAIEAGWKKAIAAVHPDRFADRSAAERRVAEQWAGRINEARDALMTPVARATELLKLRGRDIKSETDTHMDTAFLMQQMQWREAAEEAQGEARDKLIAEVDAARTKEIGVLAAALDDARDNDAAVQSAPHVGVRPASGGKGECHQQKKDEHRCVSFAAGFLPRSVTASIGQMPR